MGDYTKAEPLLRQTLEFDEAVFGENHIGYASSLVSLAGLYADMGDYTKAEPLLRQALSISKVALKEKHPDYATSLNNLATLYHRMGNYAQAEPLYQQALNLSRDILERTALTQSERQQLAMGQMLRGRLDAYLSLALRKGDMARAAFEQILLWKGATLARQRRYRQLDSDPDIAPLFKELQQVSRQLASLARAFPDSPDQTAVWEERMNALNAEQERLESELSRQSAVFRQTQHQVTLADVAKALPDNAVLLDFLEFDKITLHPERKASKRVSSQRWLIASVLHADGAVNLVDLGAQKPVAETLDEWRYILAPPKNGRPAVGDTHGKRLREILWEPLLPAIGKPQTILVSPDGILGRLPWVALPGAEPETWLLEDYQIAIVPVPQLLPQLVMDNNHREVKRGLLLVGDVDYDASPGMPAEPDQEQGLSWLWERLAFWRGDIGFPRLRETSAEITRIKALFRRVFKPERQHIETLHRESATEKRFRRLAPKFAYLHLATHGFLLRPAGQAVRTVWSRAC